MMRRLIDMEPSRFRWLAWAVITAALLVAAVPVVWLPDLPWWLTVGAGAALGFAASVASAYAADWQMEQRRTELYRAEIERLEAKLRDEGKL